LYLSTVLLLRYTTPLGCVLCVVCVRVRVHVRVRVRVFVYLVIHNDHVSTEEVVVCNDASEPLGGRVLSVHPHTVSIQRVGT